MATVMRSSILFCACSARSSWFLGALQFVQRLASGPAPWSGSIYSQSIRIVFSPLYPLKDYSPSVFPRPAVGADHASRIQRLLGTGLLWVSSWYCAKRCPSLALDVNLATRHYKCKWPEAICATQRALVEPENIHNSQD